MYKPAILILLCILCADFVSSNEIEALYSNYSINPLPLRSQIGIGISGDFVFYAGGRLGDGSHSDSVNIFNTATNQWVLNTTLSSPRVPLLVLSINDAVYFAGGLTFVQIPGVTNRLSQSTTIDIFNTTTLSWIGQRNLTVARIGMGGIALPDRNLLIYAGGHNRTIGDISSIFQDAIEVHNLTSNEVTSLQLSEPRNLVAVASARNLVFFVGGIRLAGAPIVNKFEILDLNTMQMIQTLSPFSSTRIASTSVSIVGEKVMCAGPSSNGGAIVDIYSMDNAQWHTVRMDYSGTYVMSKTFYDLYVIFLFGSIRYDTLMAVYNDSDKSWTPSLLPISTQNYDSWTFASNVDRVIYCNGTSIKSIDFIIPPPPLESNANTNSNQNNNLEPSSYDENAKDKNSNETNTLAIIIPTVVIVAAAVLALAIFIARRIALLQKETDLILVPVAPIIKTDLTEEERSAFHIRDLSLFKSIGKGFFGEVFEGIMNGTTTIAAKMITEAESEIRKEAGILQQLKHPNIVQYLGYHISIQGTFYLVTEYMPGGNLQKHFQDNKEKGFCLLDILNMSKDIAAGMSYLEANNVVHRDLALRNILFIKLSDEGNDKYRIKVADFGMSRVVNSEYYRMSENGRIPIRWAAPESLTEGKFSSRSDVWSFGILMWEMFAYGDSPYGDLVDGDAAISIKNGETMTLPRNIPKPISEVIQWCWALEAKERPTFKEVYAKLNEISKDLSSEVLRTVILPAIEEPEKEPSISDEFDTSSYSSISSARSSGSL